MRGTGSADTVETETGPALVVRSTGEADSIAATAGRTLVILRAGQAGTGAADLSLSAILIRDAGCAHAELTEMRGTLFAGGADGTQPVAAKIGEALVVGGARGA